MRRRLASGWIPVLMGLGLLALHVYWGWILGPALQESSNPWGGFFCSENPPFLRPATRPESPDEWEKHFNRAERAWLFVLYGLPFGSGFLVGWGIIRVRRSRVVIRDS